MFKYSSYWRTWSRVLYRDGNGEWIELNLTHVNGSWDKAKVETIRVHRTCLAAHDVMQLTLPVVARQSMEAALGKQLTERLLTFDYLPQIDRLKYDQLSRMDGGVSFAKICRVAEKV